MSSRAEQSSAIRISTLARALSMKSSDTSGNEHSASWAGPEAGLISAAWLRDTASANPESVAIQPTRHPQSAQLLETLQICTTVVRSGSTSAGVSSRFSANEKSP